ncbi:cell division protein FtsK [Sphaerisporangium melleum]|uniref:Cell division protein FtsK n=1 Tax=Sphaerisporangium melleum TaxID=321316 RepID=A0A917REV1_9ACTN|nr:FtsK/SpoIIIE domain-containing protein [Sphaerisporangium melleum]GGL04085.1 cell division protein FtsK [Sphaerisporangium melleum]GII73979.1 cell division protein FtsK [Sphaerisporangium melleum]
MNLTITTVDGVDGRHRDHLVSLPPSATVADLAAAVERGPEEEEHPAAGLDGFLARQAAAAPRTLYLDGRPLHPAARVAEAGIREGALLGLGGPARRPDLVRVGDPSEPGGSPVLAEVHLVSGPGAGRTWRLGAGSHEIGSGSLCAIGLSGADVPERGLWVTIAHDGSAYWHWTGPVTGEVHTCAVTPPGKDAVTAATADPSPAGAAPVDGRQDEETGPVLVPSWATPWPVDEDVAVGAALLRLSAPVEPDAAVVVSADGVGVDYNRPPRIAPHLDAERVRLPTPPHPPARKPFPGLAMVAPIVLGLVLVAVFKSYFFLAFILLSPMMVVINWVTGRRGNRKQYEEQVRRYRQRRDALEAEIREAVTRERRVRGVVGPDPATVALVACGPGGRLWERRRHDADHLILRLGTVDQPSVKELDDPAREDNHRMARWNVPDAPIGVEIAELGVVGVAGAERQAQALTRWLVAQAAVLHSPRDLRIVVLTDPARAHGWRWVRWLPHLRPAAENGPVVCVGNDPESTANRVSELVAQIQARQRALGSSMGKAMFTDPDVLVIADGARRLREVPGMVQILTEGPRVRVFSVCVDEQERLLPEECGTVVLASGTRLTVRRTGAPDIGEVRADLVDADWCEQVARALAPVRDVSPENHSGLPQQVRLLDLLRLEPPTADALLERWRRRPASTEFLLGTGYEGPLALDLVRDGPHGLVAGTTGSGKSELLQSFVASLATVNRPDELTFVLVDYKGGSAFRDCAELPHTLGMVTDLDAHLVTRALESLSAELRRRERILADVGAKDHPEYRAKRAADPSLPPLPRLLLVIDEFATLVREVPDFVPGLIGIAQRGRSLGIHLVLATQRPAGAVTGDIRANTNLRIALRVTDATESQDIIDTTEAVHISPSTPGRALVRTGHRSAVPFQGAWVGAERPGDLAAAPPAGPLSKPGSVPSAGAVSYPGAGTHAGSKAQGEARPVAGTSSPRRPLRAAELTWSGLGRPAQLPALPDEDPATATAPPPIDLQALVAAVREAADRLDGFTPQPSPWLPPLDEQVILDDLPDVAGTPIPGEAAGPATRKRGAVPPPIAYALEDVPQLQQRRVASVDLAVFGHLYVIGAPRSGRTQVLRTLAGSAARTAICADVHIYGIDAAGGGLAALEALPHCGAVVSRHDTERLERLLRLLTAELTRRQERSAAEGAAGLNELRALLPEAERPAHILLFIDGWDALAGLLDEHDNGRLVDMVTRLLREGAAAGVHVVATSERSLLGGRLSAHNDHKLLLRQGDRADYQLVGLQARKVPATVPPGRGWHTLSGTETQIALLAAGATGQEQAEALREIGRRAARRDAAVPDRRRPFAVAALPATADFAEVYARVPAELRRPMWALIGLGGDTAGPVGVDLAGPGAVFGIYGPPGSGRSTALASLAVSLLAGGTSLVVLTPRESPLRDLGRHALARVLGAPDPSAEEVQAALDGLAGPRVVVVDDADLLTTPACDRVLKEIAVSGRDRGIGLVYAGPADALLVAMGGWVSAARRARRGLLLAPKGLQEGDMIGVRMPVHLLRSSPAPGRGWMTGPGGEPMTVQVPLTVLRGA